MELFLLPLFVLMVLAAARPLGFAQAADGGGAALSDSAGGEAGDSLPPDAGDPGDAGPETPASEHGDAGPASPTPKPLTELEETAAALQRAAKADAPPDPAKALGRPQVVDPAAAGKQSSAAVASVPPEFRLGEKDLAGLTPEQRAVIEPLAQQALQRVYAERYLPVAQELIAKGTQQEAWYQQFVAATQTQEFQVAQALTQRPDVMEQVVALLSGRPLPAAAEAPPELDLSELDPQSRAIAERALAAEKQAADLRGQLAGLQERLQEHDARWTTMSEQQRRAYAAQVDASLADDMNRAYQAAEKRLGFKLASYPEQWGEVVKLLELHVKANGWEPNGRFGEVLDWALKRAGFDQIAASRKRQRATSAPPPPDGAVSATPDDPYEETRAALKRAALSSAG